MEKMVFSSINKGRRTENEIDKAAVTAVFENLSERFEEMNDNEISKQILKHLPQANEILINEDINKNEDEPHIVFIYKNKGKWLLKIKRRHKIVWAILHSYCK